MAELHTAVAAGGQVRLDRRVLRQLQQIYDALGSGLGLLQGAQTVGDLLERLRKLPCEQHERHNDTHWHALPHDEPAAEQVDGDIGQRIGRGDDRLKGADARTVWLLVVLPVTACVFYVLNILCNGKDRFYRSSVPVFLLAIYYGIKVTLVSPYLWLTFVFWIAYLAIAAFYAVTVSGHVKSTIPLLLLLLAAFAVLAAMHEKEFSRENWDQLRTILPDLLFLLGGILTLLSMKMYLDSAYHPTWGDRSDGRKLRSLDPMAVVANYIMPTRVGSSNFIRESVEISAMERYIREKRKPQKVCSQVLHA